MTAESYAVISAIVAGIVTVLSAALSHRFSARKQLSDDERELRATLLAEVRRLTDELQEAHSIIAKLEAAASAKMAKNGQ